jgi:hypothetical protein
MEQLKPAGKNNPNYWRVKATNAAGDEGAWASPLAFTTGFIMPTWVWYFLGVVGAVLIFGGGYLFGRKMANRF